MNEIESKFIELKKQLDEKMKVVEDALNEAEKFADEHSLPLDYNISRISGCPYIPEEFHQKWGKKLSEEFLSDQDIWIDEDDGYGWKHSAVCW